MEELQHQVLQDVANKLSSINIDYMLTGSMATFVYAMPRMTRDIDIVVNVFLNRKDDLLNIFQNEYLISEDEILFSFTHNSMFNIFHRKSFIKIDLIIQKRTEYSNVAFKRRRFEKSDTFEGYIISPEDLIISKVDWAKESLSEMQKNDIKSVINNTALDLEYLNYWLNELNLTKIFNKLVND